VTQVEAKSAAIARVAELETSLEGVSYTLSDTCIHSGSVSASMLCLLAVLLAQFV
jgi:hypothetical protein